MADVNWIHTIEQKAVESYHQTGVLPSVAIAQAFLESNYGRSELASKYNNLFGVKGQGSGGSVGLPTWEEVGLGFRKQITADFAVYRDMNEAFAAHAQTLARNFPKAVGATDYQTAIDGLLSGGADGKLKYATDSQYKKKLVDVITEYNLDAFDKGLPPKPKTPYGSGTGDFKETLNPLTGNFLEKFGIKATPWELGVAVLGSVTVVVLLIMIVKE